jgi:outer membrane protein assembly factor BamE (lipoprotein component of BamABCDE complex)
MKRDYLILAGLALGGCMASNSLQYSAVSEANLYHIARVRKGMSEREVLKIMHKPYSYESFQVDDEIYDVWFYVTQTTGLDQTRMVPQNLTPLTFKNGILVGTGYYWYYYAMKAQSEEAAAINPVLKKKTQDEEDKDFENLLKDYPQKPSVQPVQPPQQQPKPTTMAAPNPCEARLDPVIGMSEIEVGSIMGPPARTQAFEIAGDFYDIWFYETVPNKTGKPSIIPQKANPLIFKNSLLVSTSEEEYFQLEEAAVEHRAAMALALQVAPATSTEKSWTLPIGAFTKQNFAKVRLGMDEEEVEKRLGAPSKKRTVRSEGEVYTVWIYEMAAPQNSGAKPQKAFLSFKDSKLAGTTKEYYDNILRSEIDRAQEDDSDQNFDYW